MARPLRRLYRGPAVRNRHRTWMVSMTLATAALSVWGLTLVLLELAPGLAPGWKPTFVCSSLFALPGLFLAVLTLRAKRNWFLVALVPVLANALLLFLPLLALKLRAAGA